MPENGLAANRAAVTAAAQVNNLQNSGPNEVSKHFIKAAPCKTQYSNPARMQIRRVLMWPNQTSPGTCTAGTPVLIVQAHFYPLLKPRHSGSGMNPGSHLSSTHVFSGEV